jgi:hypothetical protein
MGETTGGKHESTDVPAPSGPDTGAAETSSGEMSSDERQQLYSTEPETDLAYALGTNLAIEIVMLNLGAPSSNELLGVSRKSIDIVMREFAVLRKQSPDMWPLLKEIARDGFVTAATVAMEVFCDDAESPRSGEQSSPIIAALTEMLADGSAFDAVWAKFSDRVSALMEQPKQPEITPPHLQ